MPILRLLFRGGEPRPLAVLYDCIAKAVTAT
jgi:hypothetical protein